MTEAIEHKNITRFKEEIIAIGRLLWEKDLASAKNGNISVRVGPHRLLITATGTCLGRLTPDDIVLTDEAGVPLEGGRVSSESLLHTSCYKAFDDVRAVIHTHLPATNAYFLEHELLQPKIFETQLYLGTVRGVEQHTPTVTNPDPVLKILATNKIAVLRRHGVVAVGVTLFDCFCLIQNLEDAVKTEAYRRIFLDTNETSQNQNKIETSVQQASDDSSSLNKNHNENDSLPSLFSREHMAGIVQVVNNDAMVADLGRQTHMTMTLAVSLTDAKGKRQKTWHFCFEEGRITEWGQGDKAAPFHIDADEKVWRAVFDGSLDPFVATTQKRMTLNGDFGALSRWYRPCSRIFEIWRQVAFR